MSATLAAYPSTDTNIVSVPAAAFSVALGGLDGTLLQTLTPTQDPAYGRLPGKAKDKFAVELGAMVMLDQARNKTAAAEMLATHLQAQVGRGFSQNRLLNDYYAWIGASRDWRLLVDAALAPEFRNPKRTSGLVAPKIGDGCQVPNETAEWWVQKAEEYQRNSAAGWREVKRLWRESWQDRNIRIPGHGNARAFWSRVQPALLSQPTCPPDLPRGWSRTTFYDKMPPEWETAFKRVGSQYAAGMLPGIPGTRKGARYLDRSYAP